MEFMMATMGAKSFGKKTIEVRKPLGQMVVLPVGVEEAKPVLAPQVEILKPQVIIPAGVEVSDEQTNTRNIFRENLRKSIIGQINLPEISSMEQSEARQSIQEVGREILVLSKTSFSMQEQDLILNEVINEIIGLGPLEELLARDDISDIMVDGCDNVFIEVGGRVERAYSYTGEPIRFRDEDQLINICRRIVSAVGRRVDSNQPIVDARLLDGSRVAIVAAPIAIDGTSLTIRKFKKDKLSLEDLVRFGSIPGNGARILQIASKCRCNILVSGGTGSGKTTLLNCLTKYIDVEESIITCEDAAELQLQQPNVRRWETRPPSLEGTGAIGMSDLVKAALRHRPERIIIGEVRGKEAFDLLQAMNTGHDGSAGTVHANSPREGIARLESMIAQGGFTIPAKAVRENIVAALDLIVQASRLRDGSRKITYITEVIGLEGDSVILQDLMKYEVIGEDKNGKIVGKHVFGSVRPKFFDKAKAYSLETELMEAMQG